MIANNTMIQAFREGRLNLTLQPTTMKTITILALCLLSFAPATRAAGPSDLIRLYEEEILAHDLYVALDKEHPDIMPLRNIPRSELMHREALSIVLKSEGVKLPTPAKGRRFVSPGLDEIFAKWLAEGKKSAKDACRVGVRLEDFDIVDLRKAQTEYPTHKDVLGELEAASNNHLRAFHRNLTARDGKYVPEALSADDFKSILDSNGNGGGGCGSCKGPGGGGNRGPKGR